MTIAVKLLLTMVTMVSANPKILNPFAHSEDWMEEVKFWTSVTCQAGRRRSFSLYEPACVGPTDNLHDFFEALVTRVQTQCDSMLRINVYAYCNFNHSERSIWVEGFRANPPEIQAELQNINITEQNTDLFPFRDVDVVFLGVKGVVPTLLDRNIFENLTILRHILVVIVSEPTDETSQSADTLRNTIFVLLKRLWREQRVLNVFFAAPFSSLGRRIWFYDPFFKNVTSNVEGKIYGLGVDNMRSVDRVRDLRGYTLRIGFFELPPSAIKLNSVLKIDKIINSKSRFPFTDTYQKYGGIDGNSLTVIAKHMNFKIKIVPPSDGIEFGYVDTNGTYIGTLGDAAYKKIDISFNSMYEKRYRRNKSDADVIEFTAPIDFDQLCVVVPSAQKIPRWLSFFYRSNSAIWIFLGLTQMIVSVVWYLLQKSGGTTHFGRKMSYHELLLNTFFLLVGVPIRLNVSQAEKVVISALLILNVTVIGVFSGTLYQTFTEEMHYKEIDTLKEVDESGMLIITRSQNLRDVFGIDGNKDDPDEIQSLKRKLRVYSSDSLSPAEKTAYTRKTASLSRKVTFLVTANQHVDKQDGTSLLHLVEECPRSYHLSYLVPKDSVYLDRLNVLIRRLQSAGLPSLWNSVTTNKLIAEISARADLKRSKSTLKAVNLRDIQTVFILMFMGYFFATLVLITEICCDSIQKRSKINRNNTG